MGDRKYLTGIEVERLITAIKGNRNEKRDRCLVLLMYRHGLRVSEACGLLLELVDTDESRVLHVRRLKGCCMDIRLNGNYGSHTLRKTWGFWQDKRGTPIPLLMEVFGHQTQRQTMAYLGIQAMEVAQIFELEL